MSIGRRRRRLPCPLGDVWIRRGATSVVEVRADSPERRAFGLGWAHAEDRGVQMAVMRVVGRGEAALRLRDTPGLFAQDKLLRGRGIRRGAVADVDELTESARRLLDAYCAGVNARLDVPGRPVTLTLLGLKEETWTPADSLTVLRLLAWTSLAQTQELVERLVVRVAALGTDGDVAALMEAFSPHLDALDPTLLRGARGVPGVTLVEPEMELDPVAAPAIPRLVGSNAWALAGSRTASGAALLANDPHLEGQTLPPALYEASLGGDDGWSAGITVPGLPGVLAGRFSRVAVGVTYAFMDQIDFFVEDCRDGHVRRGEAWIPVRRRTEEVGRKGGESEHLDIWESDAGVIEGDPRVRGRYLARAWVGDRWSMGAALDVPGRLEAARSLTEALDVLAEMPLPLNYVVAATDGGIGFQQSGLAPRRSAGASGLVPLPAWKEQNQWRGLLPSSHLPRRTTPASGFVVTANEAVNPPGGPTTVNAALSEDRVRRIRDLVGGTVRGTVDDMVAIQTDLVSRRARRWLRVAGHLLPNTPRGRALARWDGVFSPSSSMPALFERWVAEAMTAAWSGLFARADATPADAVGQDAGLALPADGAQLWLESNVVAAQVPGFEAQLFDEASALWQERDREALLRDAAVRALARPSPKLRRAKRARRSWFLAEGTPLAGLAPVGRVVPVAGGQHTPLQGRVIRAGGRVIALQPVWRMVADLSEDTVHTALQGGPSDALAGPLARSDLRRFEAGRTKPLEPPE